MDIHEAFEAMLAGHAVTYPSRRDGGSDDERVRAKIVEIRASGRVALRGPSRGVILIFEASELRLAPRGPSPEVRARVSAALRENARQAFLDCGVPLEKLDAAMDDMDGIIEDHIRRTGGK